MKNGSQNKIDIIRLQEQVKQIKDNDLAHLSSDIGRVERKVDDARTKIDLINDKLAYISGKTVIVGAIIFYAIDIFINHYLK